MSEHCEPMAYCPECGIGTDAPLEGGFCCEECAASAGVDTRPLAEKWAEWMAEKSYRCGYDYACGYCD